MFIRMPYFQEKASASQIPGYTLELNGLSTGYSMKNSIHKFFGTVIKKNHKHATCIHFQFHNLEFSQKVIWDFRVTTATVDLCMKEVIDSFLS